MDNSVGLRDLRQHASEVIRRVEAGEEVVVTVAGRPAARLVPFARRTWRSGHELDRVFTGPAEPTWLAEHERRSEGIDDVVRDPWEPRT